MTEQNTVSTLINLFGYSDEDATLPVEIAALWGAFLHEGIMDSISSHRQKKVLGQWKMGCIELMTDTCVYLPMVWQETYHQWEWDSCHGNCGIFEYEVISVLGKYLGDFIVLNNGQLPPKIEVQAMIQTLVYTFLESAAPIELVS